MEKLRNEKVDFRILVRCAPERVFDALATAGGLNEWFSHSTELDPRPGGEITFRWKDYGIDKFTGEYPGKVLEWTRPTCYVYQWEADSRGYFTTVTVDFTPRPDGTLIHLVETGYKDTLEGMQDLLNRVSGWASVLTEMKYFLEHGVKY